MMAATAGRRPARADSMAGVRGPQAPGITQSGEVLAQHLRAARVTQLGQRLGFDLPDPLAGHAELPADLLQRPRMAVGQAEPQLDDALLADAEVVQDLLELVLQHDERGRLHGHDRVRVLDEVPEVGVFLADGRLQRYRLLGDALDLGYPLRAQPHLV